MARLNWWDNGTLSESPRQYWQYVNSVRGIIHRSEGHLWGATLYTMTTARAAATADAIKSQPHFTDRELKSNTNVSDVSGYLIEQHCRAAISRANRFRHSFLGRAWERGCVCTVLTVIWMSASKICLRYVSVETEFCINNIAFFNSTTINKIFVLVANQIRVRLHGKYLDQIWVRFAGILALKKSFGLSSFMSNLFTNGH